MKKMKKMLSAVCAVAMMCGMMTTPASAAETMTVKPQKTLLNVALAKPCYSSSMNDRVHTGMPYAVDDTPESYWEAAAGDAAPYLIVDLTQMYMFKRMDVQIEPKTNFIISGSENMQDWTVIHEQGGDAYTGWPGYYDNVLRIDMPAAEDYRYIKISRPEGYTGEGFRVHDVCVYAPYYTNQKNVARGLGMDKIQGGWENNDWGYGWATEDNLTDGAIGYDIATTLSEKVGGMAYFTLDLGQAYNINYVEISKCANYDGYTDCNGAVNDFAIYGANVGGEIHELQNDPSAELGAKYEGRDAAGERVDFGPQWSTVRFDMNFTEPKRYVQIASLLPGVGLWCSEIAVYTDAGIIRDTATVKNVMTGSQPSSGGYGDMDWYNNLLADGNEDTVWTSDLESGKDHYSVQLDRDYNIRKIEVVAENEAAYNDFEIWGGDLNGGRGYGDGYSSSNDMQLLAAQGSSGGSDRMVFDVEVYNRTFYLTLVSKKSGQSFKEIRVYAEADGQYDVVSHGKTASLACITDGNINTYALNTYCEGMEGLQGDAMYPQGDCLPPSYNSVDMPTHWIDLGESMEVDFLRVYMGEIYYASGDHGFQVWGSNSLIGGWEKIGYTQTNRPVLQRYSEIYINNGNEYRYIGFAKDKMDVKVGAYGSCTEYNDHFLMFPEVKVFAKERSGEAEGEIIAAPVNIAPLAKVIDPTADENVAKIFDGNEETSYTGEWAVIDLGAVYTLKGYETVGGGDALALYGYTDDSSDAAPLEKGDCRYIAISGATDLAELRLLVDAEDVDAAAAAKCKFQDSDVAGGNEVVTLDAATLGADLYICNFKNSEVNVNMVVALYDDKGKLVKIAKDITDTTIAAYSGKNFVAGFTAPSGVTKGYEIKAFAWGDGFEPIVKEYSLVQR